MQFRESSAETEQIIAGNCVMLKESKPWTIYWFSQSQKKEHLHRMRETIQGDFYWHWAKYTILTESKPEVQKTLTCSQLRECTTESSWCNKIQQHVCWSPVNHCYKCTKRKIIASKREKQNRIPRNIGQYMYYNCLLTRLWHHKIWN